jgi:hypothetical protein
MNKRYRILKFKHCFLSACLQQGKQSAKSTVHLILKNVKEKVGRIENEIKIKQW